MHTKAMIQKASPKGRAFIGYTRKQKFIILHSASQTKISRIFENPTKIS
jgi:hypothetical protein